MMGRGRWMNLASAEGGCMTSQGISGLLPTHGEAVVHEKRKPL